MFQKIVLCADGSRQALSAAHLTADLAGRLKAQVALIHVLDPMIAAGPAAYAPQGYFSAGVTLECAQKGQQAILQSVGQILEQANVPCQSYAQLGHPVQEIAQLAEAQKADLIVMGSRGLSAWPALLLGSVSEGVARHAPCPVLIVRGEPTGFQKIVIAADHSAGAVCAVQAGMELAKEYHADVTLLNVFEPDTIYAGISRDNLDPEVYAARVQDAITRQIEPIVKETGGAYRFCQETGHPAETLLDFAGKQQADLLVVGSRGLGGFQRLLLGSVSTSVLHHAHCSVLVAR